MAECPSAGGSPRCSGTLDEHCCWVDGALCKFLEEHTIPGRRWVCQLRRELGSWEAVHSDPRYIEDVQPLWDRYPFPNLGCGTWPQGLPGHITDRCCMSE